MRHREKDIVKPREGPEGIWCNEEKEFYDRGNTTDAKGWTAGCTLLGVLAGGQQH
jgi:hypothetical protein